MTVTIDACRNMGLAGSEIAITIFWVPLLTKVKRVYHVHRRPNKEWADVKSLPTNSDNDIHSKLVCQESRSMSET